MDQKALYRYDTRAHDWDYTLPCKRENVQSDGSVQATWLAWVARVLLVQMTVAVEAIQKRIAELRC